MPTSAKPKKVIPTGKKRTSSKKTGSSNVKSVEVAHEPITVQEWDVPELPVAVTEAKTETANLLGPTANVSESTSRLAKIKAHWVRWAIIAVAVIGIAGSAYAYYVFSSAAKNIITSDNDTSIAQQLGMVFTRDSRPLQGEDEDRINILLLGIGGEGHPGGTLTDSIMIASIQPSTKKVSMISLPRDLIVKIYDDENPKYWEGRRINNAYNIGGMPLARDVVKTVTGLNIHYYALIDFSGFKQVIDDVGGIEIDVPAAFTGLYGANELSTPCPPTLIEKLEDGSYCAIPFQPGEQSMNGERALIYSRIRKISRTSVDTDQGSDFARAARQQQVLESFRNKTLSIGTLLNPNRVTDLANSVSDHLETNIELWEMAKLAEIAAEIDSSKIITYVVDDSEEGLVESDEAYNVIPKAGNYNYSEIQAVAKNIFSHTDTAPESATVQVLNGTSRIGLAAQTAELLETYGVTVSDIGNASTQTLTTTTIYDQTKGAKPESLNLLQTQLEARVGSETELELLLDQPDALDFYNTSADFIVILGDNTPE